MSTTVIKSKNIFHTALPIILFQLCFMGINQKTFAQDAWEKLKSRPSTLGIEQGLLSFNTPSFQLRLVKASQTVATLSPAGNIGFDFTPNDRLQLRSSDGMYQLGDINFRIRFEGEITWKKYATAIKRGEVRALNNQNSNVLASADLSGTLPPELPLNIRRYWELVDGHLVMLFSIKNISNRKVEVGSLSLPMIFNNIMQGKTLEQAHAENVFYDPFIGKDAGYLQVTRLNGHGPALLVVPFGKTPFEAYNPLLDDPTPRGIDFEGFYEWMIFSKAYADNEWKSAEPWNTPTSLTLKPGENHDFGVTFLLADSIKGIEQKLIENGRPVAIGVPGYVLPQGVNAKLFLNYSKSILSIKVEPKSSLTIDAIPSLNSKWKTYAIEGKTWGRARLTITYSDGLCQTINYKVIKPETEVIKDYGDFLMHQQWYQNKADPFHRDQSVITYDYDKKQQVTQDSRAWIPGLSDEGGAGGWLGAMMKELIQPDKAQVDQLQRFVDHTLWGVIQNDGGKQIYGVKKSVFYYEPNEMPAGTYSDSINYKTWAAWNHEAANDVGRSYNYPHVAAAYYVMYSLARNHIGLVTEHNWKWYLDHAYNTTMAMINQAPYYVQYGQMEGTIFYLILMDLKAEGLNTMADKMEAAMKVRANHWNTLMFPFGSEMPWDSTGQEEVYLWSKYFGYDDKATITINAILGYMPTIPNWGYNGSARRYWDFLYGGKLSRIERQLHHYGSGLNAIPLLSEYRIHPDDLYLLRVGYGGLLGGIANITEDGFGPAAFHSFPSTLKIDGLSGDYGSNFFGYAVNSSTYITYNKELGWLAFGGNLNKSNDLIKVDITSGAKSRVFIAPLNVWMSLASGTFKSVSFNQKSGDISLTLNPRDAYTPMAYLKIEQPGNNNLNNHYRLLANAKKIRGRYEIPLTVNATTLKLKNY